LVAAASAATAAAEAAAAAATTTALVLRLVHLERAAAELRAVERADRVARGARLGHLHEREAARAARLAICDHGHRFDVAVTSEQISKLIFRGRERDVPYVQLLAHSLVSSSHAPIASARLVPVVGPARPDE